MFHLSTFATAKWCCSATPMAPCASSSPPPIWSKTTGTIAHKACGWVLAVRAYPTMPIREPVPDRRASVMIWYAIWSRTMWHDCSRGLGVSVDRILVRSSECRSCRCSPQQHSYWYIHRFDAEQRIFRGKRSGRPSWNATRSWLGPRETRSPSRTALCARRRCMPGGDAVQQHWYARPKRSGLGADGHCEQHATRHSTDRFASHPRISACVSELCERARQSRWSDGRRRFAVPTGRRRKTAVAEKSFVSVEIGQTISIASHASYKDVLPLVSARHLLVLPNVGESVEGSLGCIQ